MNIIEDLFKMKDLKYKSFHSKLIPTIDVDTVIGVRVPLLRKYAKEIKNCATEFLHVLPHKYYEENNLHAFLISEISNFEVCIETLNKFLPYVDNWATCDGIRPKCFKKNRGKLLKEIKKWIVSDHIYTVRFAIEMLMVHFVDDDFNENYLGIASKVRSEAYYINMMVAWYFATALAKKWTETIVYIERKILPLWVHNKTIQKAIESYRITPEQKVYLKSLKR